MNGVARRLIWSGAASVVASLVLAGALALLRVPTNHWLVFIDGLGVSGGLLVIMMGSVAARLPFRARSWR